MDGVLFCGLVLVGIALLYQTYLPEESLVVEIASVWDRKITKPKRGPEKMVVGVNSNLDMITSATDLLTALERESTIPRDHAALNSLSDLEQVVGFSMQHCIGVERTLTDLPLFENITSIAATINHVYHIGGNGALIADKIKSTFPSIEVVLVGPVGSTLRRLLHPGILTPTYGGQDEIHMILEYPTGAQWGQVQSTCANRVIFSHDISNSKMTALEDVEAVVRKYVPDLVVLSGAHLLGGQPKEVWMKRLEDISVLLDKPLKKVPLHWELATIGNMEFFQNLADTLFRRINSLGLNEQELLSVAKSCNAPFDFDAIPQKPGVEWAADLLHWLMQTYGSGSSRGSPSMLTRVHFHSLSYHIIAVAEDGPWYNNKEAVMAGTRVAGLQACDTDIFSAANFHILNPEKFRVTKSSKKLQDVVMSIRTGWTEWNRDGIAYFFSPVLVCNRPKKTVGLGDAISSLGLVYSEFHENA